MGLARSQRSEVVQDCTTTVRPHWLPLALPTCSGLLLSLGLGRRDSRMRSSAGSLGQTCLKVRGFQRLVLV